MAAPRKKPEPKTPSLVRIADQKMSCPTHGLTDLVIDIAGHPSAGQFCGICFIEGVILPKCRRLRDV